MQIQSHKQSLVHSIKREQYIQKIALFARKGDDIQVEEKFNYFVTAHLSKSKQQNIEHHCKHFRNRIDREVFRSGKRLYKILSIEQGSQLYNEAHTHWLLELPNHISEEVFKDIFSRLWIEICGSKNIRITPILYELGGVQGLINYCTKETTYGNYGTFIEHCSDNARKQKLRQSLRQIMAHQNTENSDSAVITSNAR